MSKPKITAEHILDLLRKRHAEDVFVPECKNGPTHYPGDQGLLILDAWVMRKSWAHRGSIGYEIKVTRSDFERDQKWLAYVSYCHAFCFVCPGGLIRATDLPPGIGLLWASQNGERLHVKVKPKWHDPDPEKLLQIMTYVLMARTKIDAEGTEPVGLDRLKEMRKWVEEADARDELAHFVGEHVRKRLSEADERCSAIEHKEKCIEEFRKQLAALGLRWDTSTNGWHEEWRVRGEINKLNCEIDPGTLDRIRSVGRQMVRVADEIALLREKAAGKGAA